MVAIHHILSHLAGSRTLSLHLSPESSDVAHKAPFFQFPQGASLGEAGQILSTLPARLLWLLSPGEVAGPWTFGCALYFRHTQTLCSCCQKETETVPAFWQTNRAKRRETKASRAPGQSWGSRDNSSSVLSWGCSHLGLKLSKAFPWGVLAWSVSWSGGLLMCSREGRGEVFLLSGLPRARGEDQEELWEGSGTV